MKWLTVIDRLGAPGDSLITANVIRCIKKEYKELRINCVTPHPELIRLDPHIDTFNQPETFYSFDSTYWELIVRKEKSQNIIEHNMFRLGIDKYDYKAAYYLSEEEKEWAKHETKQFDKPILAICTMSKEPVKNWPEANWLELIQNLKANFSIIHLGDNKEPFFEATYRYAGKLSMRESAAILSKANYFIGPDSLLMHIANGLDIPSTIIFGGSRPVDCFGYSENINLSSAPECSPCWIHEGYDECKNNLICMNEITVSFVVDTLIKTQNTLYERTN
jgi:ADP-heptose:LPS heptosyltransferase